jgi:NADH-quinone oxidoreductase subunit N
MSPDQLPALLPFIVLAVGILVVMLVIGFRRNHLLTATLTSATLVPALASLWPSKGQFAVCVTPLLIMDRCGYAPYFMALVIAACLAVTLLSYGYLKTRQGHREEYYLLVLLVALGGAVVVASNHFASFFIGLEILTIAFYALIAYQCESRFGVEAGIKYLILSAVSDAFLLFGMALIYSQSGTMELDRIASAAAHGDRVVLLSGTTLLITGIGFKLSMVPFHMWTPDVYQGAPAPVTALLATVSKVAVFALLVRYFALMDIDARGGPVAVFTVIALASMIVGNLLALLQTNVKRLLAYSSIAHMGYLLVAFLAGGKTGLTAVGYYLVAYTVTTLGAFGVIAVCSGPERDSDRIEDYRGLAWRRPWLAGVFTVMLLSLAGIPLTAGFMGKFYLMTAGIGSALWLLVGTLVLTSVIGLYYYLRVVVTLYAIPEPSADNVAAPGCPSWSGRFVLAVLTALLIWWGVYPAPLIELIERTVAHLT